MCRKACYESENAVIYTASDGDRGRESASARCFDERRNYVATHSFTEGWGHMPVRVIKGVQKNFQVFLRRQDVTCRKRLVRVRKKDSGGLTARHKVDRISPFEREKSLPAKGPSQAIRALRKASVCLAHRSSICVYPIPRPLCECSRTAWSYPASATRAERSTCLGRGRKSAPARYLQQGRGHASRTAWRSDCERRRRALGPIPYGARGSRTRTVRPTPSSPSSSSMVPCMFCR